MAQPGEQKHAHAVLRGSPRERDRLEKTGVQWEIVELNVFHPEVLSKEILGYYM